MSDSERDPAAGHTREEWAPAKVNLFLRVLARRDDGYHDLETLVVPISMADRLRVHAVADRTAFRTLSLSLAVEGPAALTAGVPVDDANLVVRAARALAARRDVRGFAEFVLTKGVPNAAGLGGGSADAAAALRTLNALWACGLGADELTAVAAEVGSDVPALVGPGAALAAGRGERVTPVELPSFGWVVITFPFGVATADAFAWWDEDGAPTGPEPSAVIAAARAGDPAALGPQLFNDLEAPVVRRHPEIAEAAERLVAAGAVGTVLCGSGASLAGLLPPDPDAFRPELLGDLWRDGRARLERSWSAPPR